MTDEEALRFIQERLDAVELRLFEPIGGAMVFAKDLVAPGIPPTEILFGGPPNELFQAALEHHDPRFAEQTFAIRGERFTHVDELVRRAFLTSHSHIKDFL